jgi:hypothetical protein
VVHKGFKSDFNQTILNLNLFISVKNDIGGCNGGILIYFGGTMGFLIMIKGYASRFFLIWGHASARRLRIPELRERDGKGKVSV